MDLINKLFGKSEPVYELPPDPYKEQREKFVQEIESVMSDESKETLEKLLTNIAGDIQSEKYTFMLGYLRGYKDGRK